VIKSLRSMWRLPKVAASSSAWVHS
jgi:hypothetical protein